MSLIVKMRECIVCGAMCVLLPAAALTATNYYAVPENAGAAMPFTNWTMAATNLADVIALALVGDTIHVSNGTYRLTNELVVDKAVHIRGFNAGVVDPAGTIIDAYNYPGKPVTNRCLHITAGATIEGLTLANGNAGSQLGDNGGGCLVSGAAGYGVVRITNCIVTGNTARFGGGIHAAGTNTIISHCQIMGNSAITWGGGVYLEGMFSRITDSRVAYNMAAGDGSAVAIGWNYLSAATVWRCDIVSNYNGGSIMLIVGRGVISNCVFNGNTNSLFVLNPRPGGGGPSLLADCRIVSNRLGEGVAVVRENLTLRNCLIADNISTGAVDFGGIYAIGVGAERVESCTIAGNQGTLYGGVRINTGSKVYFTNTIVAGNSGGVSNDIAILGADVTNNFAYCCCATVVLPPHLGNIAADPGFIAPGNYHLNAASPCVDNGVWRSWMTNAVDLDGVPRINRVTRRVDMGCYEHMFRGTFFYNR